LEPHFQLRVQQALTELPVTERLNWWVHLPRRETSSTTTKWTYGPWVASYMKLSCADRLSKTNSILSNIPKTPISMKFSLHCSHSTTCMEERRKLCKWQFEKCSKSNPSKDQVRRKYTVDFKCLVRLVLPTKQRAQQTILPIPTMDCVVLSRHLYKANSSGIRGPAGDIKTFFILPKVEHAISEKHRCLSKSSLDAMVEAGSYVTSDCLAAVTLRITKTFTLSGNTVNRYGSDRRPHVIIHCPPCLHLIKAALEFRIHLATAGYRTKVRVDFRFPVSCCPRVKMEATLSFFHDAVCQYRSLNDKTHSSCFDDIDTAWIRDRILEVHADWNEASFLESCFAAVADDERCAAIVFFSEPRLFTALASKFEHMGKPWKDEEVYWLVDRVVREKNQCVTRTEMGYFSRI